jgi:ribosomal protein S18 acetylase RimI-like enzyme
MRNATEADYDPIIARVDEWWGGRPMRGLLPRLFFQHFEPTSFVIETDGTPVAFLAGFISQTDPTVGYVHFIGVDPAHRRAGLGRRLYERFFETVAVNGVTRVRAITSPLNEQSIAFHRSIGFAVLGMHADYDGPGDDRVLLERALAS